MMREPIMRIYDAHRDLHHNMHTCPEANWVSCLIGFMHGDQDDVCSCDSACFPEEGK